MQDRTVVLTPSRRRRFRGHHRHHLCHCPRLPLPLPLPLLPHLALVAGEHRSYGAGSESGPSGFILLMSNGTLRAA